MRTSTALAALAIVACAAASIAGIGQQTATPGAAVWGMITGTLSTQTDLNNALSAKAALTHAMTHQNGGSDEIATATSAANVIPKAGADGKLAEGFIPLLATSPTANSVPKGNANGKIDKGWIPTVALYDTYANIAATTCNSANSGQRAVTSDAEDHGTISAICNGSAWVWFHSIFGQITPPVLGDTSWFNQSSATFAQSGTGILLSGTAGTGYINLGTPFCLFLQDDGTNRIVGYSYGVATPSSGQVGSGWPYFSEVHASFLTPTHVGFHVNTNTGNIAQRLRVISWKTINSAIFYY